MLKAEYPEARTPRWFGQNRECVHHGDRKGVAVDQLVLHVTDGTTTAGAVSWFLAPAAKVSAHFVVGQLGEVVQIVPLKRAAWHAGAAANLRSIGIEHVATLGNAQVGMNTRLPCTDAQYAASARLVDWLCRRYSLPRTRRHIIGHNEADGQTTHSRCPDQAGFSWAEFWPRLVAIRGEGVS